MEKTEDNIEKLSNEIVESWDLDTLINFAKETLIINFKRMPIDEFQEEWNNFFETLNGE